MHGSHAHMHINRGAGFMLISNVDFMTAMPGVVQGTWETPKPDIFGKEECQKVNSPRCHTRVRTSALGCKATDVPSTSQMRASLA